MTLLNTFHAVTQAFVFFVVPVNYQDTVGCRKIMVALVEISHGNEGSVRVYYLCLIQVENV